MEELDLEAVRGPLEELYAYRVAQKYARDINSLDEKEAEFMGWVEKARRLHADEG
jgi:hypothetical protein